MELESLDLFEFYKDEYGLIDKGIGIGAAGIITPKQQINVINIPDYNQKEFNGWAQGGHAPTYCEILKKIYNLEDNVEWNNTPFLLKNDFLEATLNKMIYIHYVNSKYQKLITIDIPAYITKEQFRYLLELNNKIEKLSKKYRLLIGINIKEYVFNPIKKEILKEKILENSSKNNLIAAIRYLIVHNRISDKKSKLIYDDCLLLKEQIYVPYEINRTPKL